MSCLMHGNDICIDCRVDINDWGDLLRVEEVIDFSTFSTEIVGDSYELLIIRRVDNGAEVATVHYAKNSDEWLLILGWDTLPTIERFIHYPALEKRLKEALRTY